MYRETENRAGRSQVLPFGIAAVLIAAIVLGGCAEPASPVAMTAPRAPGAAEQVTGSRFAVGAVAGGEETNPLWTSEVDAPSFRAALRNSLSNAGLLKEGSDLRVDAVLVEMDQPLIGISMTVTGTVLYRVVDAGDVVRFEQRVSAPYTAEFSEAFLGVERLRKANEGAIRTNIGRFIEILLQTPFEAGDGIAVS